MKSPACVVFYENPLSLRRKRSGTKLERNFISLNLVKYNVFLEFSLENNTSRGLFHLRSPAALSSWLFANGTGSVRLLRLTEKQYNNIYLMTGEPDYQEKVVGINSHIMI